MFIITLLIFCFPTIAQTKPIKVQAGNVRIIRGEDRQIQVDTGNIRMSVPSQPREPRIEDDYFIPSNSQQTLQNSHCGTRSVQSSHQTNINGSRRTVTQTNISNNICQ
ncbi:hypothetical protein [Crocosphaera chwakensis]|uniref:Uncharacterized protein n=1 Tax=Crocosphaera chwakensis CCY0110 TaxID=391612 RepID=A3IP94_9CHRO|nr:hypothetical protein [Crocosphaera chwakensis]EAZ91659.1 hypothetical protein CY0110_26048 [Crocosphaera chwakensis CCY0110]